MAPCHSFEGRNLIEKAMGNIYGFMVEYNYIAACANLIQNKLNNNPLPGIRSETTMY